MNTLIIQLSLNEMIPDISKLNDSINNLKIKIEEYKDNIKEIITRLSNKSYRNNIILKNINDVVRNINYFISNMNEIMNEKNVGNKINKIFDIYNKMTFRNENNNNEYDYNINDGNIIIPYLKDKGKKGNNYQTFYIERIKKIFSFKIEPDTNYILVLNDGRILSFSDPTKEIKTIFLYNLKENKKREISFIYDEDIGESFQMEDDNIIIKGKNTISVIKIKKWEVIFIQTLDLKEHYYVINKLSNEKILVGNYKIVKLFSYKNGKLFDDNHLINIDCYHAYMIKENEIAFHYKETGVFSYHDVLIFYDLKNDKKIKSLKIGNSGKYACWCFTSMDKNFIFHHDEKFLLIDTERQKITIEKTFKDRIQSIVSLNEKMFLISFDRSIHQYEVLNEKKIKCISTLQHGYCYLYKFPGDRLLFKKNKEKIIIFE